MKEPFYYFSTYEFMRKVVCLMGKFTLVREVVVENNVRYLNPKLCLFVCPSLTIKFFNRFDYYVGRVEPDTYICVRTLFFGSIGKKSRGTHTFSS